MNKYIKNTKDMSLDDKISWVINKAPNILLNGIHDINIDISDVSDIVNNNGDILCILESEYCGDDADLLAVESAINLLNTDITLLKSTDSVLVILTISPSYKYEGGDPLNVIYTHIPYESSIIFGTYTDFTFSQQQVKATIIFLGSEPRVRSV